MTTSWDSLYLPSANQEAVANRLRQLLENLDYTLYDPFGILPGPSYQHTVRLFVGPTNDGWVRVIGSPDPRLMMSITGFYVRLTAAEAAIEAYANGNARPVEALLTRHLRAGHTAKDLQRVLYTDDLPPLPPEATNQEPTVVHALPDDIQSLANQVDQGRAQQMIDRLSSNLMDKVGRRSGTDATQLSAAAQELISQTPPDWNSPGGQRIRALMQCLTVPESWRNPDFLALRDAYQLHSRRQRKPDARLYPGDKAAMKRVPDALEYIPVYGGKKP